VTAPRFSAFVNKKDIKKYLGKVALLVGGVSLLMIATIIAAGPLVRTIFGPKYIASIPVFQAMTLAMIPFLLGVITTTPLIYSLNQPKFTSRITILQVVIIVSLDLLLIPRFQALGPTISLGVANTVVLALSGFRLYSLLK
jgi:O-antigen/teichoic acid export membrane protein